MLTFTLTTRTKALINKGFDVAHNKAEKKKQRLSAEKNMVASSTKKVSTIKALI